MDYTPLIFIAFIAVFAGPLVYGRLKYGSWSGSFLKGSIGRTIGEIDLGRGWGGSSAMKIHAMKSSAGEPDFVGLVVVTRAVLAADLRAYKLSKAQAQELARYLNQAAQ